jgi:hypothetical protein
MTVLVRSFLTGLLQVAGASAVALQNPRGPMRARRHGRDCQESCLRGHNDAGGGRSWRSRKTLWINFWDGRDPKEVFNKDGLFAQEGAGRACVER